MFVHRCRSKLVLDPKLRFKTTGQNGINLRAGLPGEVLAFSYLSSLRIALGNVPVPAPTPVRQKPAERGVCKFLGKPTGDKLPCQTCAGKVLVHIMECQKLGKCTVKKQMPGMACCDNCSLKVEV